MVAVEVAGTCAGHEVKRGRELDCVLWRERERERERESWVARRTGSLLIIGFSLSEGLA